MSNVVTCRNCQVDNLPSVFGHGILLAIGACRHWSYLVEWSVAEPVCRDFSLGYRVVNT